MLFIGYYQRLSGCVRTRAVCCQAVLNEAEYCVLRVNKMKRFCFVICFALMVLLSGCKSGNDSAKSLCSATVTDSTNPSASMSISDIVNSSIWKSFGNQQSKIVMKCGLPGRLSSPKDTHATFEQINSFLAKSAVYTKAVPKDNIPSSFIEAAGYLGPPELTISDQEHKAVINPAWYIDTPSAGRFAVHQVPNILEVSLDGKVIYLQSSSFYIWMYNEEWQPSFRNYTVDSQ